MKTAKTIITEQLLSEKEPNQEVIQSIVTHWLIEELSKDFHRFT